jgi:MFS family permease
MTTFTRPQLTAWRNAIFVVFALPGIGMATWASRLPAVQESLHASPAVMGWLLFGIAAGSIAGIAASAPIIARFGAKPSFAWGVVGAAIGLTVGTIGASAGSFGLTFLGMVIFGAANGIEDVGMNVSGAANEQALGRSIMPIFHAFFSFGTMIGAGVGVLAEALRVPIWVHGGVIAALMLVAIAVVIRFVQREPKAVDHAGEHVRSTFRSRFRIFLNPRTLLIGLVVLGAAFTEGSANDWIAIAAVDGHGVEKSTGAIVLGLFVTAMTIGRLGGVFLIDRFGRVLVLRGSLLLAAAGLLVFIFVPIPWVAFAGAVLWGLGAALGFPMGMSAAADDPATAAARVSAVAGIGYFAFLVGPPVIGFIGNGIGVLHALLVVLVLVIVALVVSGSVREPATLREPQGPSGTDTNVDPMSAG